ncbi:hypothetical protein ACJIZ3_000041 [Penstemon smallii]|uniref:Uncharacterized protein n=1 Tax=Penstemon smallii TaxID=265156 RepID=A0ABD3RNF8_9LAMI
MEFTDYKVPYPTLYVINKGETDNTRGTALAVYPPAIGSFASEYTVSKEKHPSKFSAEITKDASVDATALSKRQKVCLLQSGTPKEGSPPSFPRHARSSASWRTPWHSSAPSLGEFSYISGYWEWVDDVFARKNKNLHRAGVHDAVWASLFTYDVDEHMIRTFCHLWSPSTNTLCTSVGEFSISLNESAIDDVSKTLDVQTAKVKRTMVESSTSESDSNCDRNWKRCKKSQFEILDAPLNQEASSKGKGVEVPVDSTHSSLSQHKEICDDSDRIPLTQVLAQSKKKATSSKIPLHIPSFDNLGVQRTDPSSSKNKEVKTNFEPPARKSPSSVSGFRCKEVVERSQRKVAEIMWSDLVQQFSTTPLEGLLSIKEEVDGILQAMNQLGGMDVSFLHERVAAFLEIAGGYADEISSSSQRMDKELFDRQISDASQRLRDMQAQESQHVILAQDHEAKLTKLVEDEDNLKKRLEDILSQKQKISLLLQQDEKQLLDTQSAISGIENEISVLKSSPPLSEEDFMRQRNLKEKFEADLQELKDFKLFP